MDSLGKLLKEARELKGLNQTELARLLKVNRATLSRWEKDELEMPLKRLVELKRCLDLDIVKVFEILLNKK